MHGISLALTLSMAAHGWGGGHPVIRERAISCLPQWQQEMIQQAEVSLVTDCAALQDQHAGGTRPDLDAYCKPDGATVSLHDVNPVPASTIAMRWYLQRIGDTVRAGDMTEAVRYMGVLCHWLEDTGSMSLHCTEGFINEAYLRELIPPPGDKRARHYLYAASGISDTGRYDLPAEEDHVPVLLGRTIEEAALHLQRRQRLQAQAARQVIIPFVMDEMHGDGTVAARLRGQLVSNATRTSADALYTALCLATDRIEGETAHLEELLLTDVVSDYRGGKTSAPWRWTPFLLDGCFDQRRNILPLELPGEDGPQTFEHGVGMGVPFTLGWTFGPGGVYSRLVATVGLHPASAEGTSAIFAVLVNGEEVACTAPMAPGDAAQVIEAALPAEGDAIEIKLQTRLPEGASGDNCFTVWGSPRLVK